MERVRWGAIERDLRRFLLLLLRVVLRPAGKWITLPLYFQAVLVLSSNVISFALSTRLVVNFYKVVSVRRD